MIDMGSLTLKELFSIRDALRILMDYKLADMGLVFAIMHEIEKRAEKEVIL